VGDELPATVSRLGAQRGLLAPDPVGLAGQPVQGAVGLAERVVACGLAEAPGEVLGVAGGAGIPLAADQHVLDHQGSEGGPP
jgi:hypothetical protein